MDDYKEITENENTRIDELSKVDENGNIHEVESIAPKSDLNKDLQNFQNLLSVDYLISEFYSQTALEEMVTTLQKLNEIITDEKTRKSLFYEERGEITFIHYLIQILYENPQRFELSPYILAIFANVLKVNGNDIKEFFLNQIKPIFIYQLLGFEDDRVSADDLLPIIADNEDFAASLCGFLKKLSLYNKCDNEIIAYWSEFCPFFDCLLEKINHPEANKIVFKILKNLLHNLIKVRDKFELHKYHIYAFERIRSRCLTDIKNACEFLEGMVTYPFEWFIPLPPDWFEIFGNIIVDSDAEEIEMLSVLKVIAKWTNSSDRCCRILFEKGFHITLIESSQESTYECRKYALKALLSILTDAEQNESLFIHFAAEQGNLDFFLPFLETEDQQVIKIVFEKLSILVNHARVVEGNIPPIFHVFNESNEIMDIVSHYAEEDENDPNSQFYETAAYILTEMEGNRDSANEIG